MATFTEIAGWMGGNYGTLSGHYHRVLDAARGLAETVPSFKLQPAKEVVGCRATIVFLGREFLFVLDFIPTPSIDRGYLRLYPTDSGPDHPARLARNIAVGIDGSIWQTAVGDGTEDEADLDLGPAGRRIEEMTPQVIRELFAEMLVSAAS